MVAFVIAAGILGCPSIKVTVGEELPWVKKDVKVMRFSEKRCVKYFTNSECLKKFDKTGPDNFNATCGQKEE